MVFHENISSLLPLINNVQFIEVLLPLKTGNFIHSSLMFSRCNFHCNFCRNGVERQVA